MQRMKVGLYACAGICILGLLGPRPAIAGTWTAGDYTVVSETDWVATEGATLYWSTTSPSVSVYINTNSSAATLDVTYSRHFSYSGSLPADPLTILPTGTVDGNTAFASSRVTANQDLFDSTDISDPYRLTSMDIPWSTYTASTTDPTILCEANASGNLAYGVAFGGLNSGAPIMPGM